MKNVTEYFDGLSKNDALYLLTALKERQKEKCDSNLRSVVESHESYVGKCYYEIVKPHNGMFPEMKKYYKIISERCESQYSLSVLTFYEHPYYWFNYRSTKMGLPGDFYLGHFDFDSIEIEDYSAYINGNEISPEEYNEAMNKFIKELQTMKWVPDHYRYGGKLPSDPDWRRE